MELRKIYNLANNPALTDLLGSFGLTLPEGSDDNLGLYEGDTLLGCGFLKGNMLQGLAIDDAHHGEGLSAALVTGLINKAAERGIFYLRVITKPALVPLLTGLGLRLVADAGPYACFLEFGNSGVEKTIERFRSLAQGKSLPRAAVVVNCNPFTLGHRWLIEEAAKANSFVFVLVVEEDRSFFPFQDRFRLVTEGCKDLKNVEVLAGGEYIISELTFPAYFTRDADLAAAQGALDAALFAQVLAPALGVTKRLVGSEPFSPGTAIYNRALHERLPPVGIEVIELPRLEADGVGVSASEVRRLLDQGDREKIRTLVPRVTWEYLLWKRGARPGLGSRDLF